METRRTDRGNRSFSFELLSAWVAFVAALKHVVIYRRHVDVHDDAELHRARDYVHLLSARLLGPRSAKEDCALETIHYGVTNGTFPFSI